MKFRDRYTHTEPERLSPSVPWLAMLVIVIFATVPFGVAYVIRYADQVDSTKINIEVLGWILSIASFILLIWLIVKFVKAYLWTK